MGGAGGDPGAGGQPGPQLEAIAITPDRVTFVVGQTAAFRATGTYSDGSEADLTAEVQWRSANPAIAAVGPRDAEQGQLIVALGAGRTSLACSLDAVVCTPALLEVEPIAVVAVELEPESVTLPLGAFRDFRAFARFNDDNRVEVTDDAAWAVVNPQIATVAQDGPDRGRVTGVLEGQTFVTASYQDIVSLPARVQITDSRLEALTIAPLDADLPLGRTLPFTAMGRLSDGSELDLTDVVVWRSRNEAVAAFDAAPGVARGLAEGQTQITATLADQTSAPTTLTVGATVLDSLAVTGPNSLVVGLTGVFTATATWSDGAQSDVTDQVEWRSSAAGVATIQSGGDTPGTALAVAAGDTDITAALAGVTSPARRLAVEAVAPTRITLQPAELDLLVGEVRRFTATATFNDASSRDVTAEATWSSANPAVVATSPDDPGRVEALAVGSTRVTATLDGLAGVADVNVAAPDVERVEVRPSTATIPVGLAQPFTAVAFFGDGSERDVTAEATWAVDDDGVARISNAPGTRGQATALAVGEAGVTATFGDVESAPATLTVEAAELIALVVTPAEPRVVVGDTLQLTATGTFSDDRAADLTTMAQWESLDTQVATVSNVAGTRGLVEGVRVGEAELRAVVGDVLSPAVTVTVLPPPNQAPVVDLTCDRTGRVGQVMDFSATAEDPDGQVTRFVWDFGDGNDAVDTGAQGAVAYTYAQSGSFLVALSVYDDDGDRAIARCNVVVQSQSAPTVRIVRPQGTRDTTQGEVLSVLVDVRPGAGRDVARVALLLDDDEVASDVELPYEMDVTVPLEAASGATLRLVAIAEDDVGETGLSEPVLLNVINALPEARFVAIPVAPRRITVDASAATDDTTDPENLEVRWDFEDDGTWDTAFDTAKQAAHEYPDIGDYTVRVEVRDNIGQTSQTTRPVSFTDQQFVAGDVETTVWFGTVVLTGNVRVPAGQTLTIAEGTQVLFSRFDQNGDDVGDFSLTVQGQLRVQGTADNPVLFSVFEENRGPDGWTRVDVSGAQPSTIEHAVFEYGHDGLRIGNASTVRDVAVRSMGGTCLTLTGADDATVEDTQVRGCDIGVVVGDSDRVTLSRLTTADHQRDGLQVTGSGALDTADLVSVDNGGLGGLVTDSTGTLLRPTVDRNGGAGLWFRDSSFATTDGSLQRNGGAGVRYTGGSNGELRRNQIVENAREGVSVEPVGATNPGVVVQRNNIFANGTTGADLVETVSTAGVLTASATSNSGDNSSAAYTAPAGATILAALLDFDEPGSGSGYLYNAANNSVLRSFSNDANEWYTVPAGVTRLRVRATYSCCGGTQRMRVVSVVLRRGDEAPKQVVVARTSGTLDLRANYFGRYPDVLGELALSPATGADLQGYVGVAFDDAWDTGPYYGSEPIAAGTVWSGTVYVSGDVVVPAGADLTVEAGTQVLVAPTDQDGNGVGDYLVDAVGPLTVAGEAEAPVVFTVDDPAPDGPLRVSDWERLRVGAGSTLAHLTLERAQVGLQVNGASAISDLTVRRSRAGVLVTAPGATFDRVTLMDTKHTALDLDAPAAITDAYVQFAGGVRCNDDDGCARGELCEQNRCVDPTQPNGTARGVDVGSQGSVLQYVDVSDSRDDGVFLAPGAQAAITDCVISFNDRAGVYLDSRANTQPTLTLNGCNLFGNAAEGGPGAAYAEQISTAAILTASATSNSGDNSSAVWTPPAGTTMLEALTDFDEPGSGSGYLYNGGNNSVLASYSNDASEWVGLSAGVPSLRVRATYSCCGGTQRMRVTNVRVQGGGLADVQLSAGVFAVGRVDARRNWWGGPTPQGAFYEATVGAVDVQEWAPVARPANAVGPRF